MSNKYIAIYQGKEIPIDVKKDALDQLQVTSQDKKWNLDIHQAGPSHYSVLFENKSYDLRFYYDQEKIEALFHGERITFTLENATHKSVLKKSANAIAGNAPLQGPQEIRAMMPGKIVALKIKKGDVVSEGQGIVVLEAMKMENEIASPKAGVVRDVKVTQGQSVESGAVMVIIE